MTETQWRFLKAISDRVPGGQIVELRLFPAIRQGGAESGVAVVAVEESFAAVAAAHAHSLVGILTNAGEPSAQMNLTDAESAAVASAEGESAAIANAEGESAAIAGAENEGLHVNAGGERQHVIGAEVDVVVADDREPPLHADHSFADRPGLVAYRAADKDIHQTGRDDTLGGEVSMPRPSDTPRHIESAVDLPADGLPTRAQAQSAGRVAPAAAARVGDHEVFRDVDVDSADAFDEDTDAEPVPTLDDILVRATWASDAAGSSPRPPKRYAVLAARYRLTLKGPDRGHWDFEITHEADAPLDTVDRVARGVARRAGDEGEPESFSAFQLQSTLSQPWWNTTT